MYIINLFKVRSCAHVYILLRHNNLKCTQTEEKNTRKKSVWSLARPKKKPLSIQIKANKRLHKSTKKNNEITENERRNKKGAASMQINMLTFFFIRQKKNSIDLP